MKNKTVAPFKAWLGKQKSSDPIRSRRGEPMNVPEFVEEAKKRGVITANQASIYKAMRGSIPRNRKLYEQAFVGIKF